MRQTDLANGASIMASGLIHPSSMSSRSSTLGFWRRPHPWVLAWALYTLLALGWFGYQEAWLGSLCQAPR